MGHLWLVVLIICSQSLESLEPVNEYLCIVRYHARIGPKKWRPINIVELSTPDGHSVNNGISKESASLLYFFSG